MNLPTTISPCPIADAVFETRFETDLQDDAVLGVVYQSLSSECPKIEPLAAAQIPYSVRQVNPDIKFVASYRLVGEKSIVLVGPRTIAFVVNGDYPGWPEYRKSCERLWDKVHKLDFIQKISRRGLRYINFFEGDRLSDISLKINIADVPLVNSETTFRTVLEKDEGYTCHLQVANHMNASSRPGQVGTIIDIDVFSTPEKNPGVSETSPIDFLEKAHTIEKSLFFSLLSKEFLNAHNPQYP